MLRIDAHQHFWKFNPVRDSWITEDMNVIRRDFYPQDLKPLLAENKIDGCVSVQADQSEEETLFLIDQANKEEIVKGVVGWVDLKSPSVVERLEYFSQFKKIKGFRHIVQAEPDNAFLLRKDFGNGIRALKQFNFTYDVLIYPQQLEAAIKFVFENPDQRFVIDHLAKPLIKKSQLKGWEKEMAALAVFENVHCKVSGMVTEANWLSWKESDFKPFLDVVFSSFGTKRVMYGSDWPVCLVAASYKSQLAIVENYIASFSETEKADIMGNNAIRFYNL
jgi:L-fuconolactonase